MPDFKTERRTGQAHQDRADSAQSPAVEETLGVIRGGKRWRLVRLSVVVSRSAGTASFVAILRPLNTDGTVDTTRAIWMSPGFTSALSSAQLVLCNGLSAPTALGGFGVAAQTFASQGFALGTLLPDFLTVPAAGAVLQVRWEPGAAAANNTFRGLDWEMEVEVDG